MDMHVLALEDVGRQAQRDSVGAHIAEVGCRRLLHDITELPRQDQALFLAGHGCCLDEDDLTSHGRPDQSGGDTGTVDPLSHLLEEALPTQVLADALSGYMHGTSLALGDLAR